MQPISIPTIKMPYMKLYYPTYVKDIDLDVHIRVFKKVIKANGSNCIFEEFEQAFCKRFRMVESDKKVYMQLQNI